MTLPKEQVVEGLVEELQFLHSVIQPLTENEWALPTRCVGWTIADLGAHVTGVTADITTGRLEGAGTQEWYDRQVTERKGRPADAIARELAACIPAMRERAESVYLANWNAPAPQGLGGTIGLIAQSLWCGFYIHAEDLVAALDLPARRGTGLHAAVAHIAEVWNVPEWGPVTLALDGMGEIQVGGGGRRITGDPLMVVLAASGRSDPARVSLDPSVNIYG